MIQVRRHGRGGNLLEEDGPVLRVEFGPTVVRAIFRGTHLEYRYQDLRTPLLYGYAHEDKFHILPVTVTEISRGLKRDVGISTDPGGDIYLELGQEAGKDRPYGGMPPTFAVEEISDRPQGLLDRGIDTLVLPSLFAIEQERMLRLEWGLSNVDPEWQQEHGRRL